MISYLDGNNSRALPPEFKEDIFGKKICWLYLINQTISQFADFWVSHSGGVVDGLIGKQGQTLLLAGGFSDMQELSAFLPMSGALQIIAKADLVQRLARFMGCSWKQSWIFRYCKTSKTDGEAVKAGYTMGEQLKTVTDETARETIIETKTLTPVYKLLAEADPLFQQSVQYDYWLAEMSHQIRHGFAQVYLLEREGIPVSTLTINHLAGKEFEISAVATRPDCRKTGAASKLLGAVCSRYGAQGQLYVLSAVLELRRFYERNGFAGQGQWGSFEIQQDDRR